MTALIGTVVASFSQPIPIDTNPASMLWLLPLVASIAIVYKATKVSTIRPRAFAKECAVLFGSIMVFILVAALILYVGAWVVAEQWPKIFG
ncbi:MAG: hypothetical protein JW741_17605 [Sedimentisphaerales bacterium]|nr:hypothetical protein [Sedimentisphaerales bacterium]